MTLHICEYRSKELIIKAINGNDFLKNLEKVQINEIVDCMYIRDFAADQYICREGGVGTQLYVLAGRFSYLSPFLDLICMPEQHFDYVVTTCVFLCHMFKIVTFYFPMLVQERSNNGMCLKSANYVIMKILICFFASRTVHVFLNQYSIHNCSFNWYCFLCRGRGSGDSRWSS